MWDQTPVGGPVLAIPDMVLRVDFPGGVNLAGRFQSGPTVSTPVQNLAPSSQDLETVGVADQWKPVIASDLPVGVQETIDNAQPPSTRRLYFSMWKVFEFWCVARAVDPVSFSVRSVLEFLQEKFDAGEAAITLRVYVTNIAARQESDEVPLGMLSLVSLFIHCVGAWGLCILLLFLPGTCQSSRRVIGTAFCVGLSQECRESVGSFCEWAMHGICPSSCEGVSATQTWLHLQSLVHVIPFPSGRAFCLMSSSLCCFFGGEASSTMPCSGPNDM